MSNIVRLRVELKEEPDAFKNMLRAWKRGKGWIEKEFRLHSSHQTETQKKRRKRRQNKIRKIKKAQFELIKDKIVKEPWQAPSQP